MFIQARLSRNANRLLRYHERKVSRGEAKLIHAKNFLHPIEKLAYPEMRLRFKLLNDLNTRTKVNMVSVIFSFPGGRIPSEDGLMAISDRYMKEMELQDHPYLVYRHNDTKHTHLHVVGNLIGSDGKRSEIYLRVMERHRDVREQLAKEFDLVTEREIATCHMIRATVGKLIYGEVNLREHISHVLSVVFNEYNFINFQEYNSALRAYNISAQRTDIHKRTNRSGLIYQSIKPEGHKIGQPFPASRFDIKPTWKNLERRFVENARTREETYKSLQDRLDVIIFREPKDQYAFCQALRKKGIEAIVAPDKKSGSNDLVLVDHHSRIAVSAADLERKDEVLRLAGDLDQLMASRSKKAATPQSLQMLLEKREGLTPSNEVQSLNTQHTHKIGRHV